MYRRNIWKQECLQKSSSLYWIYIFIYIFYYSNIPALNENKDQEEIKWNLTLTFLFFFLNILIILEKIIGLFFLCGCFFPLCREEVLGLRLSISITAVRFFNPTVLLLFLPTVPRGTQDHRYSIFYWTTLDGLDWNPSNGLFFSSSLAGARCVWGPFTPFRSFLVTSSCYSRMGDLSTPRWLEGCSRQLDLGMWPIWICWG